MVGITGTIGAGKGTVVGYLVDEKGFHHYSARTLFIEELAKRSLPIDRDHMTELANALRAEHGPTYVFEQLFAQAQALGQDAVIESVRTVAEAQAIKTMEGAVLLAVDAPRKLRFERIRARKSELDNVTFEEFCAQEDREMSSTDPNKQNIGAVLALADAVIENTGSLEELHHTIDRTLVDLGIA